MEVSLLNVTSLIIGADNCSRAISVKQLLSIILNCLNRTGCDTVFPPLIKLTKTLKIKLVQFMDR